MAKTHFQLKADMLWWAGFISMLGYFNWISNLFFAIANGENIME